MNMNWKSGLLRLWLVVNLPLIVYFAYSAYTTTMLGVCGADAAGYEAPAGQRLRSAHQLSPPIDTATPTRTVRGSAGNPNDASYFLSRRFSLLTNSLSRGCTW